MGCASSKGDINDQHPNIFQVMNVDEQFQPISPGQIEITDTELVFHQRGKPATKWSLRNLRKYGFDGEIFSFECGRRCATGAGIFAFRCRKAEQLFNLLQHNIQVRNMSEEINIPLNEATSIQQIQIQRRGVPEGGGYLNPVNPRPTLSRPGSITSNGPISPTSVCTPPLEDNNNKRPITVEHSYLNTEHLQIESNLQYINVMKETPGDAPIPLYMNVDTAMTDVARDANIRESVDLPQLYPLGEEEALHCYANVDTNSIMKQELMSNSSYINQHVIGNINLPSTPIEVNYVELDLVPSVVKGSTSTSTNATVTPIQAPPESPNKTKSYVTIDFNKTNALSQSINPRIELEEGCRKTRHNSTISDVRHSSSISD